MMKIKKRKREREYQEDQSSSNSHMNELLHSREIEMLSSTISSLNLPPRTQLSSPNPPFFPQRYNLAPFHNMTSSPFPGGLINLKVNSPTAIGCKSDSVNSGFYTLMEYMGKEGEADDLVVLFGHLEYASKKIAALVASPFNSSLSKNIVGTETSSSDRDKPKPLDLVSNEIILSSLRNSGKVAVMASEEDEAPVWITDDGPFVVVMDPLDGSRNIDASIPTGTIFGIYRRLVEIDHLPVEEKASLNCLQSGAKLVAAAYVLYSSATILCASFGSGTHAFTLDHTTGDFLMTHPNISIPPRGQIYSVNDARYFDWPEGLRQYIDTIRQGKGKHPKKYSARYICSLVADFHRTLLYGGIAMNPRDHLRLVYEANPLSFLAEKAGGRGSDGKNRILSIQPVKLHQRLPLFLGSPEDIEELQSYGDVQQKVNPGYDV